MSIDWQQLLRLREHQREMARRSVARDRGAADASQAQLLAAQGRHEERVQEKLAHWQSMVQGAPGVQLGVAQLRHAEHWSTALDAQIALAQTVVAQAGQAHAQCAAALDQSRKHLRAAHGELEKARRVCDERQREARQGSERRQDEAADEAAAQRWARRA